MSIVDRIPDGVRRLFRLPLSLERIMRDLDDEIRFHVEARAAELRAGGMPEREAIAAAIAQFGDADDLRVYCRGLAVKRVRRARAGDWFAEWAQDLRFALRQFARAPGFTVTAALMLALGIGANTAIFSVVNHLLIAPLPFAGGNRMVVAMTTSGGGTVTIPPMQSLATEWRARAHTVTDVMAVRANDYMLGDSTRGPTEQVHGVMISPSAMEFVGVRPLLGRGISASDTLIGAPPVVVLSEGLWQRALGGSADALGKSIMLDQTSYTVIGVMPDRFYIPFNEDARQLFTALPSAGASDRQIDALAKLRAGSTIDDANREFAALFPPKSEHNPYADPPKLLRAVDYVPKTFRQTVLLLFAAVGLVLLIACANVANLVLARSWSRQREFAIRSAMGAGRGRLIRQVLTESLMLALAGGVVGVGVAVASLRVLRAAQPGDSGRLDGVHLDLRVLLWSLALTMLTGLLFGIAPALFASGARTGESLKSATRTASAGAGARRFRSSLVILEVALSVVLLAGAGLLTRSLVALNRVDSGMNPRGLWGVPLRFTAPPLRNLTARSDAARDALARVRALAGVRAATYSGELPPEFGTGMGNFEIEGIATAPNDTIKAVSINEVDPDYFRVVGLAVRQGRLFTVNPAITDQMNDDEVLVNESFARRYWPKGNPIGARIRRGNYRWSTIVGVVADIRVPAKRSRRMDVQIYSARPSAWPVAMMIVRTDISFATLLPALTAAIHNAHPAIRIAEPTSAEAILSRSLDDHRFTLTLLGAFAVLALVLAAVGLHGVIAYSVIQRTREIGVRVALGAHAADVARLIVAQGLRLAAAGIVIGVAAAVAATRALGSLLYGVSPGDPFTVAGVSALMLIVALVATYAPARRASRLDPVEALRAE